MVIRSVRSTTNRPREGRRRQWVPFGFASRIGRCSLPRWLRADACSRPRVVTAARAGRALAAGVARPETEPREAAPATAAEASVAVRVAPEGRSAAVVVLRVAPE